MRSMFGKSFSKSARATLIVGLVGAFSTLAAVACPTDDPSVVFCEEFSESNPLAAYTIVNPMGNNYPFAVSIVNEALVYTNSYPGLAFASAVHNNALAYRNTLFEVDERFNTQNAGLRSAMAIAWSTLTPFWQERIIMNLQLDEDNVVLAWGTAGWGGDRRYYFPLNPSQTYRLGLAVEEVPGLNRPTILAFKGYVNGTLVFSETEDTLGINLSTLPLQMQPVFQGGSYAWSPVDQVFDNAIIRQRVNFACVGFESPIGAEPVTVKKSRALPFKAMLLDEVGGEVTSLGSVPPVVQITYAPVTGPSVDVTDQAVPVGLGTEGNQFVYAEGKWQFNLQTKAYTAPGTYTVTMAPGDGYTIQPTCTGSFVIK